MGVMDWVWRPLNPLRRRRKCLTCDGSGWIPLVPRWGWMAACPDCRPADNPSRIGVPSESDPTFTVSRFP